MFVDARQVLLEEGGEGGEVGSHEAVVHPEEGQVGAAVEEVGEAGEGIARLHVEQEDAGQEGHSLHVAHVRSIAGVRPEDIVQHLIIGATLHIGREIPRHPFSLVNYAVKTISGRKRFYATSFL